MVKLMIKVGNIVSRNSYNNDILFEVVKLDENIEIAIKMWGFPNDAVVKKTCLTMLEMQETWIDPWFRKIA